MKVHLVLGLNVTDSFTDDIICVVSSVLGIASVVNYYLRTSLRSLDMVLTCMKGFFLILLPEKNYYLSHNNIVQQHFWHKCYVCLLFVLSQCNFCSPAWRLFLPGGTQPSWIITEIPGDGGGIWQALPEMCSSKNIHTPPTKGTFVLDPHPPGISILRVLVNPPPPHPLEFP